MAPAGSLGLHFVLNTKKNNKINEIENECFAVTSKQTNSFRHTVRNVRIGFKLSQAFHFYFSVHDSDI